jgi:hypothetical protein
MHLILADRVLAAVNDCHVFAEEARLSIVEYAAVRRVWTLFIA